MTDQPIMLGGRYRLDEIIGRGGMAEVWRAWDTRLGRDVAVKRLRVDLATDPTFQARFQREAQSAAGLNHPNIVAVYDTGAEIDYQTGVEVPYIVMELVQGTTLRDLLRDGRQILPERSLEFTAGVLEALTYAHRHGIVHRDIKPANVMLTPAGMIKVMDFGIARAVSDTSATMTQTAAVIGTAQYLSPEQARGETVDARSDIYSTGCLLYELLTSRPPFIGDSPVSVAYQHVREQPIPPCQIDPHLSPGIDIITMTSLAKDPNTRYQSAQAMREDIQRLLDGQYPIGAVEPGARPGGDSTRILGGRPAPGTRPKRGFTDAQPRPIPVTDPNMTMADVDGTDPTVMGGFLDQAEEAEYSSIEPTGRSGWPLSPAVTILIVLLVLLLTAGGVVLFQMMKVEDKPHLASVPTVVGLTEQEAKQKIYDAHLIADIKYENTNEVAKDTVLRQDPEPDMEVQIGSTVTIWVSAGPEMGTIPDDLEEMTCNDARKALLAANFPNVELENADLDWDEPVEAKAGDVLAVDPPSGSSAPLDGTVTLICATGKSAVPDLVGMTLAEAKAYAKQLGFVVSSSTQVTDKAEEGTVIKQRPDPGTYESRGKTIFITIAKAPAPTTTPPGEDDDE